MQRNLQNRVLLAACLMSLVGAASCDKLKARDQLNKGVQAYRNAQFDVAIEHFKTAEQLDPGLTNARLYLATAYASQYIPGAPSQENIRNGQAAIDEYKQILQDNPDNLNAIDGIGSILYNMGTSPYDEGKLQESKQYHEKHIQLSANDPDPYYWVGVIDWTLSYRANLELRDTYNRTANPKKQIKESDPLPQKIAADFTNKYSMIVDDGITSLNKAISLRPDYDDAMAYLNLMLRQKADMETSTEARNADLKQADDLVDKVKAIKQKKAQMPPTS